MHPVNYDLVIKHQQFEIERAARMATRFEEVKHFSVQNPHPPRSVAGALRWLFGLITPPRTQRAAAD